MTAPRCPLVETGHWIRRANPSTHRCRLPELNMGLRELVTTGDRWACDVCTTVWEVTSDGRPGRPPGFRWTFQRVDEPDL